MKTSKTKRIYIKLFIFISYILTLCTKNAFTVMFGVKSTSTAPCITSLIIVR